MSTLMVEIHRCNMNDTMTVCLKDRGLGRVFIDQLPDIFGSYRDPRALLVDLKHRMASMYFYCAPRDPIKSITMTWDQASQTAQFLKEIV